MPLTSSCRNCGLSKTPDFYGENYCENCTNKVKAARELAVKENLDIGAVTKAALAEVAHDIHRNRPDPRFPLSKSDGYKSNESGIVILVLLFLIVLFAPVTMLIAAALS